jgi:hypothetical protein
MREQELATPAAGVAARAAAARCGEAGKGQREAGKAAGKAQEGTWHGLERCGGGQCAAHGRRGRRGSGVEKQTRRGLEVDEGGSVCNFPKVQGLLCKT